MRIGLTYDLRSEYLAMGYSEEETAEFDRDDTIVAIETALETLGHIPVRIGNAFRLIECLSRGERWDLVFNIAEGLNGISREAQVPSILDVYRIPYTFSDAMVMALTLHKGMTKHIIRDNGYPTPAFRVVEGPEDISRISFAPPFFVKPVSEGTGKGVSPSSVVQEARLLQKTCETLLHTYKQPVLVEQYLSGREFTVGILGTGVNARVLGTLDIMLLDGAEENVYSYVNKERCEELVEYRLALPGNDGQVQRAETVALACWQALGCRDGGRVDLRCDADGNPNFLEVNPLAGLHPEHSDLPILCNKLGIPYVELIEQILSSALSRVHNL
ncbi:MAG: D-alanine--D-alanine ligase [Pseudomonadota bacterium]